MIGVCVCVLMIGVCVLMIGVCLDDWCVCVCLDDWCVCVCVCVCVQMSNSCNAHLPMYLLGT
jgi:hypothetical protein